MQKGKEKKKKNFEITKSNILRRILDRSLQLKAVYQGRLSGVCYSMHPPTAPSRAPSLLPHIADDMQRTSSSIANLYTWHKGQNSSSSKRRIGRGRQEPHPQIRIPNIQIETRQHINIPGKVRKVEIRDRARKRRMHVFESLQ